MTLVTGERDTLVSALFSVSCVIGGTSFRLLVVVGFTYSPVKPLLLLTGRGIVVSRRRVDGCGGSSSDLPVLFRFPRFSIEVSTCCLEEFPGVGIAVSVSSASSSPSLAGVLPRDMVVVTGFVYSPGGAMLLLVCFVVVSREWVLSDLFLLFGFSRLWKGLC